MKKIFALVIAPVVLLLILVSAGNDQAASPTKEQHATRMASMQARQATVPQQNEPATDKTDQSVSEQKHYTVEDAATERTLTKDFDEDPELIWEDANGITPTDSLIAYAMSLMGSPYVYGGTSDSGFDCSGFTSHVYQAFGVPVTRSSTTQSEDGIEVDRTEARPGDLIIFTGTDPQKREPGHVGIVISEPGDTISFVHSSSNGGVKVSQVEGTGYEVRFMGVRRVL